MSDHGSDILFDLNQGDKKHISPMLLMANIESLVKDYIKESYKEHDIKLYEEKAPRISSIWSQSLREAGDFEFTLRESDFDPDGVNVYGRLNFPVFLPEELEGHGGAVKSFMGKRGEDRIRPPNEYKTMTFHVNSPDHESVRRSLQVSMDNVNTGEKLMERIAEEISSKYKLKTYFRKEMADEYQPLDYYFKQKQEAAQEEAKDNRSRPRRRI